MLVAASWWNRYGLAVLATGGIAAILEGTVQILLVCYGGFTLNGNSLTCRLKRRWMRPACADSSWLAVFIYSLM